MRWPWQRPPETAAEPLRALERRLQELEDDVVHLERRLTRLQGRLTGGLRDTQTPEPEPGKGNGRETILELLRKARR